MRGEGEGRAGKLEALRLERRFSCGFKRGTKQNPYNACDN